MSEIQKKCLTLLFPFDPFISLVYVLPVKGYSKLGPDLGRRAFCPVISDLTFEISEVHNQDVLRFVGRW